MPHFFGAFLIYQISLPMVKQIFLVATLLFSLQSFSQEATEHAPYWRTPIIPPFTLLKVDSTSFTNIKILRGLPTVIVYFSPECSHCQQEAKSITDSMALIPKAQFIFASYHELDAIKEFADKYGLNNHSNIVYGRDITYAIPSFFKVKMLPFIAVYNSYGKLTTVFETGAHITDIAAAILK